MPSGGGQSGSQIPRPSATLSVRTRGGGIGSSVRRRLFDRSQDQQAAASDPGSGDSSDPDEADTRPPKFPAKVPTTMKPVFVPLTFTDVQETIKKKLVVKGRIDECRINNSVIEGDIRKGLLKNLARADLIEKVLKDGTVVEGLRNVCTRWRWAKKGGTARGTDTTMCHMCTNAGYEDCIQVYDETTLMLVGSWDWPNLRARQAVYDDENDATLAK